MLKKNVFEEVAKLRNTTTEKVMADISFALAYAQIQSPEIWQNINGTLEEQIAILSNKALASAS